MKVRPKLIVINLGLFVLKNYRKGAENMTPDQLRKSYVGYMKRIGASQVPSASLLPEND